jgi:hypothetical protein
MAPFTRRPDDDPTNIRQWLAGRGARRRLRETVPTATPVPPEPNDAVEAPQRQISPSRHFVLEADNSPVPAEPTPVPKPAEPKKAENCGHCGKPLPTLRSAGAEYCNRYCAKAARKARAYLLSGLGGVAGCRGPRNAV